MREIEDLELSLEQGPCFEAYRTGQQVLVDDLELCRERWPELVPRIITTGLRSTCAFPLRLSDDRLGALEVYRCEPRGFGRDEVRVGQALADIAAVGILQERVVEAERRSEQLQRALTSRILIEQAKGVLAERHDIPPREAFERLRRHARNTNRKLRDVCRELMDGELGL